MGRALTAATGALGLTVGLRVRYARPAEPGQAYEVRGAVAGRDGDVIKTLARLTEPSGGLVAAAEATFRLVDAAAARRGDAGLPGRTLAYIDDELAEQASP
jgi:acyl-coenzyme A thioesterase PaaI-like protein